MKPVSPWLTTVVQDIAESDMLYARTGSDVRFEVRNAGDSIWIVTKWQTGSGMAFRAAFGLNSRFEVNHISDADDRVDISLSTRLGFYTIEIQFFQTGVFRYTTTFKSVKPMMIPFWPRDIAPLVNDGLVENTAGIVHTSQIGSRTGQLFFSFTKPKNGSVFYCQNLGAISKYCEAIQAVAGDSVGGSWPEIGLKLPTSLDRPLPAGAYVISDAFISLSDTIPKTNFDVAEQFLDSLGEIYRVFPKPETHYINWPEISQKSLDDLIANKGCWTYADKNPYLNAYLCDYDTPPEIMVQLSVMQAITEYGTWSGKKYPVVDEIKKALPNFYDKKLGTIARWLPSQRDNLDESEEQKSPMTMDSWYLHHPLMNLSKLALDGDKKCESLLLDSVDYAIKVAHRFKYKWPVFYKMDTLEIVKAETSPGMGGEKDVAGGYTHLMMNVYKLTGEKRYLNEAVKAAKSLTNFGLDIFYQANNTAFSALALLRLYHELKDEYYLRISYLCIAGIMRNVQLWESDYGYSKNFPGFFGVYPLRDAPYRAAYEEMEVYAALNDYIREAGILNVPILSSLQILLPEFVKYSINRLVYFYPPMLPSDIISDVSKTGEIDPELWIPLEDLYDGWTKNGQVGQEVYGAGVGFGVAPRQYKRIKGENFQIYCEYPIINFKVSSYRSATFDTLGEEAFSCYLRIVGELKTKRKLFKVYIGGQKDEIEIQPLRSIENLIEYKVPGATSVKIKWQ